MRKEDTLMEQEQTTVRGISPRRLAIIVGLAVMTLVAVLAVAFYRELGRLIQPSYSRPVPVESMDTQDVQVQRGALSKMLRLFGTIQPGHEAKLALRSAQAQVLDVPVFPGQDVQAGQTLLQLDVAALQRELAKLSNELLEARRELADLVEGGELTKRIQLQEQLRQARSALDEAQQELEDYVAGKDTPETDRARAVADLAQAVLELEALRTSKERQQQLDELQVTYNEAEVKHGPYVLIAKPSEQDRDIELILRNDMLAKNEALQQARLQYEMDIRTAEHQVVLAQRRLRDLERGIAAGSSDAERFKREAAVQQYSAKVQAILSQLVALDQGAAASDVAKAEAKILKLEGKVADAQAAVAEATVVAPFDGMVDQVNVFPGMSVSPGTVLVTVLDTSSIHVLARLSEVDVAQIHAGKEVQLTFDAFPGETLAGTLGEIPGFGTYENGVTLFDVRVSFDGSVLPLRVGMGATVGVPLLRKEDVLMVPLMAVHRDEQGAYVFVVNGQKTQLRRVELGISDGINIEVTSGLEQGELVRATLSGPIRPFYQ
jgi:RND family efflux transporter MFP subunit